MLKLRWLQVNKFRAVKPGTRLTFHPGYNVLLGQNGTGKTTLLNLIAAVVRHDFTEFKDLEFDLEYELSSELGTASVHVWNLRQEKASGEQATMLPTRPQDSHKHRLSARFKLASTGGKFPTTEFVLQRSTITVQVTDNSIHLSVSGRYSDERPSLHPEILHAALMSNNLSARQAREKARAWESLTEYKIGRFDESLAHFSALGDMVLHASRHSNDLSSISYSSETPLSSELIRAFGPKISNSWGQSRYSLSDDEVPFLGRTVLQLGFKSAEVSIELQESERDTEGESMKLGNLKFLFIHPNGLKIIDRHLSHGQKRMLAFMHYLATTESIAIADELVNGLHHRWIRACIEAMGQRQVFLTSQNPLLLDYLRFESPEDVRNTFVLCQWDEDGGHMLWQNMSQEAAEDFFASYKVGFQQVGELLQTKGLW